MQCRRVQGSAGRCRAGRAHAKTTSPLPCALMGWACRALLAPQIGAHAAMIPIFEATEDGQSKRGVLGKELVQAPQAHALLPILVRPQHADGANIVPANNDGWRPSHGGQK